MLFPIVLVSSIFLLISKLRFKSFINPVSLLTGSWFFCIAFSLSGLYDLRIPSSETITYALLFVAVANITMLLLCSRNKRTRHKQRSDLNKTISLWHVVILEVIGLLLLAPLIASAIKILLQTFSISAVRDAYYGQEYEGRHIFNFFFRQVPLGILDALIIVFIFLAFDKKRLIYLFVSLLNVFLISTITGGRWEILLFIISAVITLLFRKALFFSSPKKAKEKRFYKYIIVACVAVFMLGLYISVRGRGVEFLKGLYTYYAGSMSYLDLIFAEKNSFGLSQQLYGYLSFGFIIEPVILALKFFNLTDVKTPMWFFNTYCQPFQNISNGSGYIAFNNNTSILYFLYYDFGPIGFFVGGVLFGMAIAFFYNRVKPGFPFLGLVYIYLLVMLLLSPMYYRFYSCSALILLVALYFSSNSKPLNRGVRSKVLCR